MNISELKIAEQLVSQINIQLTSNQLVLGLIFSKNLRVKLRNVP